MISGRLVDLDKEIEQHLINWKKDEYFKTLTKDLQKKIIYAYTEGVKANED